MIFVHIFATPPGGGGQTDKYTPLTCTVIDCTILCGRVLYFQLGQGYIRAHVQRISKVPLKLNIFW